MRRLVMILAIVWQPLVESFHNVAFHRSLSHQVNQQAQSILAASPIASTNEATDATLHDINGKDIKKDSVVRVTVPGLKACHVNPKSGFGSYNDKKEFVYNTEMSHLLIPQGLTGVVTRVYDMDVIGANFPILVKFTPGEHTEGGYDAPVAFLMHFLPEEVECV